MHCFARLAVCFIMLMCHTHNSHALNHTNHTENWSPFHAHWVYHEHDGVAHYHYIHHSRHHVQSIFYIVFQDVYKIMPFTSADVPTQANVGLLTFLVVTVTVAISLI